MNTRIITRLSVSTVLLLTLVSCPDSTQFAEKTLAGGFDATKATVVPSAVTPSEEDPSATTDSPTGDVINEDNPTGVNPDGSPSSGTNPDGSSTGSTNPTAVGTGTGAGTGTGTGTGSGTGPGAGGPSVPGEVFKECSANPDMAIVSQLYQLPPETNQLPNFSTLRSIGDVCVAQLNIADREFTAGFPGVSDIFEWFALDMRFKLNITKAGNYQFFINSDDGSILSIDNAVIVNNDGLHSQQEKSGSVYLGVGVHDVQVRYYQGPRVRIALELFWKVPGSSNKVYVPKSVMSRP